MKTERKKHKHYDLMMEYYANMNQDLWVWSELDEEWLEKDDEFFSEDCNYAIGEKPASPPVKMITYPNGTIEFYAPISQKPLGQVYFCIDIMRNQVFEYFCPKSIDSINENSRDGEDAYWCSIHVINQVAHLTERNARLHLNALLEFLQNYQPK